MIAKPLARRIYNETICLVSFFFVLWVQNAPIKAWGWQGGDAPWSEPSNRFIDCTEQASSEQWLRFINLSSLAVLGPTPLGERETLPPDELHPSKRVPWLSKQINRWTQSPAFIDNQAQAWILDRYESSPEIDRAWNYRLHDTWVRNSIARSDSFLRFIQSQIAGDVLSEAPDNRLATAAWFRSSDPLIEAPDNRQSRDECQWQTPTSPTPDRLTENLRWTSISNLPWLYFDAPEPKRLRLIDLEKSMASVLKSEQRDWQRLQHDGAIPLWHRAQLRWPLPNPSDLTFSLAQDGGNDPPDATADFKTNRVLERPLRYTEPWTVILEFEAIASAETSRKGPTLLVQQRADCDPLNTNTQRLSIIWDQGKILVQMIHSLPNSYLAIETESIQPSNGAHTIGAVYDGLPSADSIRIWADGRWLKTRCLHQELVRDFAATELPLVLDVQATQVTQLECYRSALSAMELEGWRQTEDWVAWDACSDDHRVAAREHYARRFDAQWRYQRESLAFYAHSFASVLSSVDMVPLAESTKALRIPRALAQAIGDESDSGRWSIDRRRDVGRDCESKLSINLSSCEVSRQWRRMLAATGKELPPGSLLENDLLARLRQPWSQSWDRRQLIRSLLLSDEWLAIALDSAP